MKLIVGLGNPGKEYECTRHNVGFRVLDSMCSEWSAMTKCSALVGKSGKTLYAKPQTFMNLSGQAMQALLHYYKIDLADLLVVYDDKDLPFGTLRLRDAGSSAGHNGMNSIIETLGTEQFSRLRIGIAPTDDRAVIHDTADFVLTNFTTEEEKKLPDIIDQAKQIIQSFVS